MLRKQRLQKLQYDVVEMAKEVKKHKSEGNEHSASRVQDWLEEKLINWKNFLEASNYLSIWDDFNFYKMIRNVETAIGLINEDKIIVSLCEEVAKDIRVFKEVA